MLDKLTAEDFQGWIGQSFKVEAGPETLEMELLESSQLGQGTGRQAFSVLFRGPADKALLQATYSVSGGDLDQTPLFLVPVGPDKEGMLYEAVFT